jgi:hypothetical protein
MAAIKILVNGEALDLPPDFTIQKEEETSLFNREVNRINFTYPANIPLTEKNNLLLGFISHLAVGTKSREVAADLYINGMYDNKVTLRIIRVNTFENIIELSIIGTYGTFARLITDKKLTDLHLGGDRTVGTTSGSLTELGVQDFTTPDADWTYRLTMNYYPCDTANHMKDVALGNIEADYFFYPAVDLRQNIVKLHDSANSILNLYDWDSGVFTDPIIDYYRSYYQWGGIPQRLFWVPFFKTLYVLRKCFEEHGFKVSGDIFSSEEMQRASLYNTTTFCQYSMEDTHWQQNPDADDADDPENIRTVTISNRSTVIHPQNHMPDMTVLAFLNELAKAWNLQYRIDLKMQTVNVVQLKNFKANATVLDFTGRAFPDHEISFEDNDLTDGYKFEFSMDPAETNATSKTKDTLGDYPIVTSVGRVEELTGTFTLFDLAYVRNENAYYQYGGSNWFFYSFNTYPVQTKSDAENPVGIATKVVPIMNEKFVLWRLFYQGGPIPIGFDVRPVFLPVTNIGIKGKNLIAFQPFSFNFVGVDDANDAKVIVFSVASSDDIKIQPLLCYYRGFTANGSVASYPFGSSFNFSPSGAALQGGAHFWDNPDHTGLYYNRWKPWTDNLINSIPVKYDVLEPGGDLSNIDFESTILFINGQQYILKKASRILPNPSVSNYELIRI